MSRVKLNSKQKKILKTLKALKVDGKMVGKREIDEVMLAVGITYEDQTLQLIDQRCVKTDYTYQRHCHMGHTERLGTNWDQDLCDIFRVSERKNGSLYSQDQNHTKHAILWRLEKGLPVNPFQLSLVRHGMTRKEEARTFLGLNNRRSVNGNDKFKASIIETAKPYVNINREVQNLGFTLAILPPGFSSKDRDPNSLIGVYILKNVWDYCPGQLSNALTILKGAWSTGSIVPLAYCKGEIVMAIAKMLMTQVDRAEPLSIRYIISRLRGVSLYDGIRQSAINAAADGKVSGYQRVAYLSAWLCNVLGISRQSLTRRAA